MPTLLENRLENAGDHKQADDENDQDDSANYFEHARAPRGMNVWGTSNVLFSAKE